MGGTRALLPVLQGLLNDPRYELALYAGKFGQPVLSAAGIKFDEVSTNIELNEARAIFDKETPDLLLSATSWNSNVEQQFRNESLARDIRSVVVFDYWSNPATRWDHATYTIAQMPDTVCVMDEVYRQVMLDNGFPDRSLVVTGQPHLEKLSAGRSALKFNALPQKILFLSQPNEVLGFSIERPLEEVIKNLDIYAQGQKGCQLTVKLHPKEDRTLVNKIVKEQAKTHLTITIEDGPVLLEKLVEAHDVVLGYRSMGLFEAKAMGRPTFAVEEVVIEGPLQKALQNFGIPIVPVGELKNLSAAWKKFDQSMAESPYAGATAKILTLIAKLSQSIVLTGEKIYLKPFLQKDLNDRYISWFNDRVVCRDNSHGDPNNPYDRSKATVYVHFIETSKDAYVFAIRWNENSKHIGNAALSSIDWTKKSGMVTIIIGEKEYWGKGVGTEVYQLLLEFGFHDLGLERITSGQTTRNVAMIKVCEHVGMKKQGLSDKKLIKDGETLGIIEYAMTKNEYESFAKRAKVTV